MSWPGVVHGIEEKEAEALHARVQGGEVVALIRKSGKTPGQVARDLELTETSVRAWLGQAEIDEGVGPEGALTTEERAELAALRRENKTLRLEREY